MAKRSEIIPTVVEAIAEVEDISAHDLDYALYDYIDTTALESLVTSDPGEWMLEFRVPDHTVRIEGTGEVFVDDELIRTFDSETPEQRG